MTTKMILLCGQHQVTKEWRATTFEYAEEGIKTQVPDVSATTTPPVCSTRIGSLRFGKKGGDGNSYANIVRIPNKIKIIPQILCSRRLCCGISSAILFESHPARPLIISMGEIEVPRPKDKAIPPPPRIE